MKESFEIGKESPENKYENRFPEDWPEFKKECMEFFERMQGLNIDLMKVARN